MRNVLLIVGTLLVFGYLVRRGSRTVEVKGVSNDGIGTNTGAGTATYKLAIGA